MGYLCSIILQEILLQTKKNTEAIPLDNTRHNFYRNLIFQSARIEKNNLDRKYRKSEKYGWFHFNSHIFIRSSPNSFYEFL